MSADNKNTSVTLFETDSLFVEKAPDLEAICLRMQNGPVQCFSPALLGDLERSFSAAKEKGGEFKYAIVASRTPGIFNFGGDLGLFAQCVRNRDYQGLVDYGVACLKCVAAPDSALEEGIITIALVQGDALGGGFEAAMACSVVIAEKGTTLGLPETMFNLFPGMGAMPLIARKTNIKLAQDLMLSGRLFTAEEGYELGLVDVLADPGNGEVEVARYIGTHRSRHNGRVGVLRARNATFPVRAEQLLKVVEIWAETGMKLGERDLKLMERLVKAQGKRWHASV